MSIDLVAVLFVTSIFVIVWCVCELFRMCKDNGEEIEDVH